MHSSWSITYSGPHHGTVLKKLERAGKFKALDVERERFLVDGAKVEHASFLIAHGSTDWPALAIAVLETARLLLPVWRIQLGSKSMRGDYGDVVQGNREGYKLPVTGLRSATWHVNENQHYVRHRWVTGQPDRW